MCYELPSYAELVASQMKVREWSEMVWGKQMAERAPA